MRQIQERVRPAWLAILALSIASADRTFTGLLNFTGGADPKNGDHWRSIVVCVLITFGVQMLMMVLARYIGDAYATADQASPAGTNQPSWPQRSWQWLRQVLMRNFLARNFVLLLSFAVCAGVCVFFSLDAFYDRINDKSRRQITAGNEAFEIVRKIDAGLTDGLRKKKEKAIADLVNGPAWERYSNNLDQVIAVATDPAAAESQRKREEERKKKEDRRIEDEQRKMNAATVDRDKFERDARQQDLDLKALDRRVAELDGKLRNVSADIENKQREIDETQRLLDKENENGNDGQRKPGKGPQYRAFKEALKARNDDMDRLIGRKETIEREIEQEKGTRPGIEADLQKAKLGFTNAASTLKGIRVSPSQDGGSNELSSTPANEAKDLKVLLGNFEKAPASDLWTKLVTDCTKVVNQLRDSTDTRDRAATLDCTAPSDTTLRAEAVFELDDRIATFRKTCSTVDPETDFRKLIQYGNRCLQISKLQGEDVAGLRKNLNLISKDQDESAHSFTRTLFAFQGNDDLIYLALLLALGLDGLILLCGIWDARARVSHLTRRDTETAAEIDSHAAMTMAMEVRANRLRADPDEPADAYKARMFLRHLEPLNDPAQSEYGATISVAGLAEFERQIVNGILAIGPYAKPVGAKAETWLVSNRLVRYLTRIVARYDRLHVQAASKPRSVESVEAGSQAPRPAVAFHPTSYWASAAAAAAAANDGQVVAPPTEEQLIDAGIAAHAGAPVAENDDVSEGQSRQPAAQDRNESLSA